jgi:hypothetical protein
MVSHQLLNTAFSADLLGSIVYYHQIAVAAFRSREKPFEEQTLPVKADDK